MLQIPAAILDAIESLHLPSIPQILLQFLHLAEDDRTTITDLATLVGQDPSLSARFLTVANSPALSHGTESRNLTQCLVTLGTRLSRTLAACLVVQRFFSPTIDNQHYCLTGFWEHSLLLAESSRALAQETGYTDVDECYLAGLLHDVGQLLLLGGAGKRYGALLAVSEDEDQLRAAEQRVLNTDHAMVGAWLIDQWKLSSFMADAILFHHSPPEAIAAADPLSRIVWCAHVLGSTPIPPETEAPPQTEQHAIITELLGITNDTLTSIHRCCRERVARIADSLEIHASDARKTIPAPTTPLEVSPPQAHTGGRNLPLLESAVRDMAVTHPLLQGFGAMESETELLLAVRESARILFGLGKLAFLFVQEDGSTLAGAPVNGQPELLRQISIPADSRHSLAVAALRERRLISTFSRDLPAPVSLADAQISRLLESEGLLYVPIASRAGECGVMAYGVNATQAERITGQLSWIMSFGQVTADSLACWRGTRARMQQLETETARRFQQRARQTLHEAGNPLAIIRNYLSIIRNKLPDQPALLQEMDILREEIDRVTTILRRMASPAEELRQTQTVDVNGLIESMLALYGDALFTERGIALEKNLDSAMKPICADRDSIKQILTNLWNNASDAMGAGDCFFIATHADVNQNGHPYVEISMSDTGPGLPPDIADRLFQPLDPQRRPGHSGVGLSIAAGLVERLKGRITCQNRTGGGTCFSILLPHARGNAP